MKRKAGEGLGKEWLLQELVKGRFEYATSLLVQRGSILQSIGTAYEYGAETYVWPRVRLVSTAARAVPQEELSVMTAFLEDYTGICNFNYKLDHEGRMRIFEINTRIGGDLITDAPQAAARALFEKLDALGEP